MTTFIEKLQQKFDFIEIEETVLKGHSNTIILKNYVFETEETDILEPLRIELNQIHRENKAVDYYKVSIVNYGTDDEPQDLFWTNNFEKVNNFISAILE
jgi:hypothetical protein